MGKWSNLDQHIFPVGLVQPPTRICLKTPNAQTKKKNTANTRTSLRSQRQQDVHGDGDLQPNVGWKLGMKRWAEYDCASKICTSDPFKVQVMRLPGNSVIANNFLREHYLIEGQWFSTLPVGHPQKVGLSKGILPLWDLRIDANGAGRLRGWTPSLAGLLNRIGHNIPHERSGQCYSKNRPCGAVSKERWRRSSSKQSERVCQPWVGDADSYFSAWIRTHHLCRHGYQKMAIYLKAGDEICFKKRHHFGYPVVSFQGCKPYLLVQKRINIPAIFQLWLQHWYLEAWWISYFARSWICFVTTKVLWTLWRRTSTGKESTTPDTALLHPTLSDLLLSILVDKQGFFDAHSPVIFKLQVPSQQISRKTFFGILPLGFPFRLIEMTDRKSSSFHHWEKWNSNNIGRVGILLKTLSRAIPVPWMAWGTHQHIFQTQTFVVCSTHV